MKPCELVPAFTPERLVELASIVVKIRYRALLDHKPGLGDGPWGLGTRVYERMIKQLAKLSIERKLPWLVVRRDGLYISLKIDGWPLRIYRGPADNPKSNALQGGSRDLSELVENQPSFRGFEPDTDGEWFWLMAIETVGDGTPVRVVVQQANLAGLTRHGWEVPVDLEAADAQAAMEADAEAAADSQKSSMAKDPIEVDKAVVRPKGERRGASGGQRA